MTIYFTGSKTRRHVPTLNSILFGSYAKASESHFSLDSVSLDHRQ